METGNLLRHRVIKDLTAQYTDDKVADASIELWEQMASQIILIVGEGGFNSLYTRSLFLTRSAFPWLPADSPTQTGQPFAELKISFEGQPPLQASQANSQLLITFTDILASLIGEHLTIRILCSAWGNDALDKFGKEFKNE